MADQIFSQVLGKVGPGVTADGSVNQLRQAKTLELISSNAHGKYYEAASRGKLFVASIGVAGVAPGTALSTSPAFQIYNPTGSGILVSIKQVFVGYVSGTLGAGMLVHSVNLAQPSAPTGGTAISPVSMLLNSNIGVAKAFTGSTIAATSTLVRPSIILGASLASTAALPVLTMDEVDGSIVIPPGVVYCYQAIAAGGSTPLVSIAAVYEEIQIP